MNFSEELCKYAVISPKVNLLFAALDHDRLDSKLRIRYLLQLVDEGVKDNASLFDVFLEVLAGYGGCLEKLARCLGEEGFVCGSGAEGQGQGQGAGKSQAVSEHASLSEDDVADLMKILVGVSYKWEELGIALRLPKAVREECKSGSNNTLRLENILHRWLTGGYKKATPPTLMNLKQVLASELVGVADVALSLEEKFRESQKPSVTMPVAKSPDIDPTLRMICQSLDTKVADGKSTLLEVLVSKSEGVSYQWKKDGQAISDSLAYTGTHSAILAISPAIQGTQGKYICHAMKGSEEVICKDISLTVNFSPRKKLLIDSYSKDKDVPKDSWPPHVTSTFINLVLVTNSKGVTADYEYSIRGNVDDILETKEKIEFKEVFGTYERGALMLVEGRPGSGKTTLMHKVSRDWGTSGEVLKNGKLVFNFPLQSLENRMTKSLSDLLRLLYPNQNMCDQLVSDIENSNGEGVCFIIDGLDEFHPEDETKSVIHQLLYDK